MSARARGGGGGRRETGTVGGKRVKGEAHDAKCATAQGRRKATRASERERERESERERERESTRVEGEGGAVP
jgi:hypothetical protein